MLSSSSDPAIQTTDREKANEKSRTKLTKGENIEEERSKEERATAVSIKQETMRRERERRQGKREERGR